MLFIQFQFKIPNESISWTILCTRSQKSCSIAIIAVSLVHLIIPRRFRIRMSLNNEQQNYLCMSVCPWEYKTNAEKVSVEKQPENFQRAFSLRHSCGLLFLILSHTHMHVFKSEKYKIFDISLCVLFKRSSALSFNLIQNVWFFFYLSFLWQYYKFRYFHFKS